MRSTMDLLPWLGEARRWDWDAIADAPGYGLEGCAHRWDLLGSMRELVDKPGQDIFAVTPLVWGKGDGVKPHAHPEHTVIFYVEPTTPIVLPTGVHHPRAGETVILAPNEEHAVPISHTELRRISIAMRVSV